MNVKWRLEPYSLYEREALEAHLQKMAAKGWMLEKIGNFFWTYRRTKPRELSFCVCCFPKASEFDPGPSEEQQTFYDFCAHTGWKLAASAAQLQVFYNEQPSPVPIETDPVLELDAIHRSMMRSIIPSKLFLLAVALLNGALFIGRLQSDPIRVLSSISSLFAGVCWIIAVLSCAENVGSYFLWRRRALRAAQRGEFLNGKSAHLLQALCLAVFAAFLCCYFFSVFTGGDRMMKTITLLMFCLYLPGLFLAVYGFQAFLKKKKAPAGVNQTLTMAVSLLLSFAMTGAIAAGTLYASAQGWFNGEEKVYESNGTAFVLRQDALPLSLETFFGSPFEGHTRERRGDRSLLLSYITVQEQPRYDDPEFSVLPSLSYTIVHVKAPFLYPLCKDAMLHARDHWNMDEPEEIRHTYMPVDAAPWGAQEAYQWMSRAAGALDGQFLVFYEDRIIRLECSWAPTSGQITAAAEALRTAVLH